GVPRDETVPLLGRPGDAAQIEGDSMLHNLVLAFGANPTFNFCSLFPIGTGILAQIANVLFLLTVWVTVLSGNLILFSGHPLAVSVGVFALVQSILVLQPTHTAPQKRIGQRYHAAFNTVTFLGVGTGITVIEYNKVKNGLAHFHSVHAYFGVATGALMALQLLAGVTMWAVPALYGGEQQAKNVWKYHRMSGYLLLVLVLATVVTATQTDYIATVVKIKTWSMVLVAFFIVSGVFPRVQKKKLGF
ncbi:hypothetical protein TD95_005374, partial [Thielaviopsis punctulata]